MTIAVDINHPADVHFFKNFIWAMEKRGHDILTTATEKDVSFKLLNNYGFEYVNLGSYGNSLIKKLLNVPVTDLKMYKAVKSFKPDIFVGLGSIRAAHLSKMFRSPCIAFENTEHSTGQYFLYAPFTDVICTPSCFKKDLGKKQIRYRGYKELAYLHPTYFTPNPAVLDEIGLSKDDTFIILRFVSWSASHDVGQHGIKNKIELVRVLEKYARVFITSEGQLPKELEKYNIKVSPEKLHDLLYYASLYIGEGSTTASECAVLGTHAIYVNTLRLGYTDEEEEKYNLVYNFSEGKTMEKQAFDKALELLKNNNLRREGKRKRERLLKDKIDVTAFMVWFIENYPESFYKIKENPEIQLEFRRRVK
jgi:predicted glycosyltransferase